MRKPRKLQRTMVVITVAFATLMMGATAAMAASPHIVGNPTATVSGNTLTLSASVAGLGNVPTATFDLTGTVDVSSRCYTKSGNKPQAANKQETISVNQSVPFDVRNGRTNATFTVTPLSTLDCPNGQVTVIESVTYNLVLMYGDISLYTFKS